MVVERDGVRFTIGEGGDFSWAEMAALQLQIDRWNTFRLQSGETPGKKLPSDILEVILEIKKIMPGAEIDDWKKYWKMK